MSIESRVAKIERAVGTEPEIVFEMENGMVVRLSQKECDEFIQGLLNDRGSDCTGQHQ
jgi:hypothetical protein